MGIKRGPAFIHGGTGLQRASAQTVGTSLSPAFSSVLRPLDGVLGTASRHCRERGQLLRDR